MYIYTILDKCNLPSSRRANKRYISVSAINTSTCSKSTHINIENSKKKEQYTIPTLHIDHCTYKTYIKLFLYM